MSLFFRLLLSLMRYRASFQLFNYWNLVPLIQGFRLVIEQQHWVPGLTIVNMWKNVTICVCVLLLLLQEEQRRQAGKSLNRSSAEPHFESQSSFWRSPNFFFHWSYCRIKKSWGWTNTNSWKSSLNEMHTMPDISQREGPPAPTLNMSRGSSIHHSMWKWQGIHKNVLVPNFFPMGCYMPFCYCLLLATGSNWMLVVLGLVLWGLGLKRERCACAASVPWEILFFHFTNNVMGTFFSWPT